MKKRIAVESELSNVSEYLENQGYDVLEFQHNVKDQGQWQNIDAIVTTGIDQNFLSMHEIQTEAPVINASGLSPVEISQILTERFE